MRFKIPAETEKESGRTLFYFVIEEEEDF